ncbi:metal-dependent hydrolase [Lysobacter sp. TY2-98]|uniref:metal-dependent hydrolase n=1 Tax=Lysobacter sp. TY2-98 TaxID=2290922 RepID=UPI000E2072B9|nr:metal-dependent hydrolase [Lysobacter sp. TY2-98]AXK70957.1 metal-dependent hydrolase [Lysobacter sp. TY2-98]
MPSVVGHFAIPLASRIPRAFPPRLLVTGLIASMLPDADTIGALFGIERGTLLAHRGVTHSLAFALVVAGIAVLGSRWLQVRAARAGLFVLACALSHPLLDLLTNGGPGVMIGWPLSDARVFAPWRPIEVSPIGAAFLSARGLTVVASELVWVVAPALMVALAARRAHRK